jgi:hypothetical protein
MNRRILADRTRGIFRLAGTDWPITDQLVREQMPGRRPTWCVIYGLCNGLSDYSSEHRTLTAARREWDGVLL